MNLNDIRCGLKVKTSSKLGETTGMLIRADYLANRRPNVNGAVMNYVPGHGGDVWWVQHEDGVIAPYVFDELAEA